MQLYDALNALTPPYNKQAIENTNPLLLSLEGFSISQAIRCAFIWDKTTSDQGFDYWDKKHKEIKKLGL